MKYGLKCGRTCPYMQACIFQTIFDALGSGTVLSHVADVDVKIRDLDALKTACEKRGLQLRLGQKTYKWYGRHVGDYPMPEGLTEKDLGKCTHAIHLNKEAYEIGLLAQSDGSYRMLWDFWSGGYGLQNAVGKDCRDLIGDYTIEAARNAASAQQWLTEDNKDGSLTIFHPSGGKITVNRFGKVDLEGFVGTGCATAGYTIEQALGTVSSTEYKSEYWSETDYARLRESN